jgi:hypothetical protein
MVTFRFISSMECRRRLTQEEFAGKMAEIQRHAAGIPDMHEKTIAFWKMENLGAAFLRNARPGQSLNDPCLPIEILPIAHCGIGVGAVERANFHPSRIIDLIESFSNPAYRLFAYENIGAMLGVYEPDPFTIAAKALTLLGLLPIAQLRYPERDSFLGKFGPETRRLISHGYGRMLYFKQSTLSHAITLARTADGFDFGPCVQGMAFGYSMVNSGDLHRAWKVVERIEDERVRHHFSAGLVFALMFWEWMAPGSLASLSPRTEVELLLIEAASRGMEEDRARGALRAFAVDREPTAGISPIKT